jgi:protein-L-isoaspartate(D-aspartate) O-methyltransferase
LPVTGLHDHGAVFLFRRVSENGPLSATAQSFTRHYPCLGTRSDEAVQALTQALIRPISDIASLRLDSHEMSPSCWLHGAKWCLSCLPVTLNKSKQDSAISP